MKFAEINYPMHTELCRFSIVGTTGSGKTELAQRISQRLAVPYVELDKLQWETPRKTASVEHFAHRVDHALCGHLWVADGNFKTVRPIIWARADTVVWLDYPLPYILNRLIRRNGRVIGDDERKAVTRWAMQSHRKRRRKYPEQLAQYPQLTVCRLRTPRELQDWFCGLPIVED